MIDKTKPPPSEQFAGCVDKYYQDGEYDCYTSPGSGNGRLWDIDGDPCDPCRAHYDPVPPERWRCVVCGNSDCWSYAGGQPFPVCCGCCTAWYERHADSWIEDARALRLAALAGHYTAEGRPVPGHRWSWCASDEVPAAPTEHPVARWEREGPRCMHVGCRAVAYHILPLARDIYYCDHHRAATSDVQALHAGWRPLTNAPTRSERIAYELERRARAERYEVVCQGDWWSEDE